MEKTLLKLLVQYADTPQHILVAGITIGSVVLIALLVLAYVKLVPIKYKYKYKVTDLVWAYGGPNRVQMLGRVINRDGNEKTYLVQDVYNIDYDTWIKQKDLLKLELKKPNIFKKFVMFFTH